MEHKSLAQQVNTLEREGGRGVKRIRSLSSFWILSLSLSLSFHLPFIPSSSLYNISLLPRTEGKETVGTRPTKEGIPEMQEEEQSPFSSPPSSFEKFFFLSLPSSRPARGSAASC